MYKLLMFGTLIFSYFDLFRAPVYNRRRFIIQIVNLCVAIFVLSGTMQHLHDRGVSWAIGEFYLNVLVFYFVASFLVSKYYRNFVIKRRSRFNLNADDRRVEFNSEFLSFKFYIDENRIVFEDLKNKKRFEEKNVRAVDFDILFEKKIPSGLAKATVSFKVNDSSMVESLHLPILQDRFVYSLKSQLNKINELVISKNKYSENKNAWRAQINEYVNLTKVDISDSYEYSRVNGDGTLAKAILMTKDGNGFLYENGHVIPVDWTSAKADLYRDTVDIFVEDESYRRQHLTERRHSFKFDTHQECVEWVDRINLVSQLKNKSKSKPLVGIADQIMPNPKTV